MLRQAVGLSISSIAVSVHSPSAILTMLGAVGRCSSGALQALKPGINSLKTISGRHAALSSSESTHFLNIDRLSALYVLWLVFSANGCMLSGSGLNFTIKCLHSFAISGVFIQLKQLKQERSSYLVILLLQSDVVDPAMSLLTVSNQ